MSKERIDDYGQIEVKSADELRSWLQASHQQGVGVWLITYKKHCGERYVAWSDVVDELLCFGWIDGRRRKVDADRTMQLISPRRPGSPWSAINKRKVVALEVAGRMTDAGRVPIEAAKADGTWTFIDDIELLVVPDDLHEALTATSNAREAWRGFPDSSKKQLLWWIKSAKTTRTRSKRIEETARLAGLGIRANHPESRGK